MADADITKVIHSVGNPRCLALRPRTEEREELLELVMPLKDAPMGEEVAASIEEIAIVIESQQNLLQEVFEDLEVTNEHRERACSGLVWLSIMLNPSQLMTTLKATTCSLIQINALEGFLDKPRAPRRAELPDDTESRVRATMAPNPNVKDLLKEKENSSTHLLVATFAYKLLHKFSDGGTQQDMQKKYNIKAKQLGMCIMDRKYMGGSDHKTTRKRKASGEEASTNQ